MRGNSEHLHLNRCCRWGGFLDFSVSLAVRYFKGGGMSDSHPSMYHPWDSHGGHNDQRQARMSKQLYTSMPAVTIGWAMQFHRTLASAGRKIS